MAEVIADDISVCTDCAMLIANGETGNGIETDERVAAAQVAMWGNDARWLVLTCGDECDGEFSTYHCEGCDEPLPGNRHKAAVIR